MFSDILLSFVCLYPFSSEMLTHSSMRHNSGSCPRATEPSDHSSSISLMKDQDCLEILHNSYIHRLPEKDYDKVFFFFNFIDSLVSNVCS